MISFKWLGVAGIQIESQGQVCLVDPYLTRFSNWFWQMAFGRLSSDIGAIRDRIKKCDYVLVTHAHWDHFLDVPEIVRLTGAEALGSPNVCDLLRIFEIPHNNIHEIKGGERMQLGNFEIEVLPTGHPKSSGFGIEWSKGTINKNLRPPLRVGDYRMDFQFGFLIRCNEVSILHWGGLGIPKVQADLLFIAPYNYGSTEYHTRILESVQPKCVIPIHWDVVSKPLIHGKARPTYNTFGDGNPMGKIIDLDRFRDVVHQINPSIQFIIPEIFQQYSASAAGILV